MTPAPVIARSVATKQSMARVANGLLRGDRGTAGARLRSPYGLNVPFLSTRTNTMASIHKEILIDASPITSGTRCAISARCIRGWCRAS